MADAPSRPRRVAFVAGLVWLATLSMGLATLWVVLGTDLVQTGSIGNGRALTPDELLIIDAVVIAFFALVLGYASVGALLAGRAGAGRIAALLLAGGAVFVLVPFGYAVGGSLVFREPGSALFNAILLLGPVSFGPEPLPGRDRRSMTERQGGSE